MNAPLTRPAVWRPLSAALGIGLLAALAIDFGFRAAFVSDGVAFGTTAYTAALVATLVGRQRESTQLADRLWLRIPVAVIVGGACVWLLRGPLLFDLPGHAFQTTGHSPYVVVPVTCVLGIGILELWARAVPRGPR